MFFHSFSEYFEKDIEILKVVYWRTFPEDNPNISTLYQVKLPSSLDLFLKYKDKVPPNSWEKMMDTSSYKDEFELVKKLKEDR